MKNLPRKELLEEVAIEIGIPYAFVEKDWFAMQLLSHVQAYKGKAGHEILFSGGISLSKGYELIKRFSEDLDFVIATDNPSRPSCSSFRKGILEHINASPLFLVDYEKVLSFDRSHSFKADIEYHSIFSLSNLRPHLQLEMKFLLPRLEPQVKSVRSFLTLALKEEEDTSIACVSPLEIAGDKLSALTWRLLNQSMGSEKRDRNLVRHLHDLSALESVIEKDKGSFCVAAQHAFSLDREKGAKILWSLSPHERIEQTIALLQSEGIYRLDYQKYIENMSFAPDDEKILFDEAIVSLKKIDMLFKQGSSD